ncbi:Uncharacterised protein [Sphingobacterium spiritivorum]|uniref:Uncharacterized protein n=1 Tax=Sphingobacterium spiritivorum TaxID=258 RepID=A0A380BHC5_SPHSI|nr:hypothetical protein [Sphingobacterium spiritivorum]SUJ01600.1 Uncharacterised protein [Sphingobacterium spiritivorum]
MEKDRDILQQLMKQSTPKMPFSDFEDQVMARIEKQEMASPEILKVKMKGICFFLAGTIFGLVINYVAVGYMYEIKWTTISKEQIMLFSQLILCNADIIVLRQDYKAFQIKTA